MINVVSHMTAQEVFNTVVAHLRKQGRQALTADRGGCAYRSPNGDRCAAGCLIPDEHYQPRMENKLAHNLAEFGLSFEPHTRLVDHLQDAHDSGSPNVWERSFEYVARAYDLTYTPPPAA